MTITAGTHVRFHGLRIIDVPIRLATPESFKGYGRIVPAFDEAQVDIVPWPLQGKRRLDAGTGVGGGITSGIFKMGWKGDVLYADNYAVGGFYVTGWTTLPNDASEIKQTVPRDRVLACEANYHPDGGQIFFPRNGVPFVALLALPTDDIRPGDFVAFYCTGDFGIHLDAGVWHQPVYPLADSAEFDDKQGAVHACVSVDFAREFGCLLSVPLKMPS